jgi:hypothetical protein
MPYKDAEKAKEQKQKWKKENPEKVKKLSSMYYDSNKEKLLSRQARHRKENLELYLEREREWRNNNRDKILQANLKKAGWTLARYVYYKEKQKDLCSICGHAESKKSRLSADHNHVTGKPRELLCSNCNAGLGQFKDSPEILKAAAQYLERLNAQSNS